MSMTVPVKALLFGTAGVPDSSPSTSTVAALDPDVCVALELPQADATRA